MATANHGMRVKFVNGDAPNHDVMSGDAPNANGDAPDTGMGTSNVHGKTPTRHHDRAHGAERGNERVCENDE
jgi:hypothetical protein